MTQYFIGECDLCKKTKKVQNTNSKKVCSGCFGNNKKELWEKFGDINDVNKAIELLNKFQGKTTNYYHSRFLQMIISKLRRVVNCSGDCNEDDFHKSKCIRCKRGEGEFIFLNGHGLLCISCTDNHTFAGGICLPDKK